MTDVDLIEELKKSDDIKENDLGDGIVSYKFKNDVFYNRKWNSLNVKARGLFWDTRTQSVVARSYDKFFNVGEIESVEDSVARMTFPVNVFVKENGYLGLASKYNGKFFTSSKSVNTGPFADMFRSNLKKLNVKLDAIPEKHTAVFEVIDIVNDPHIIEYSNNEIILLDCIENKISEFKKLSYDDLSDLAGRLQTTVKKLAFTFHNKADLMDFIRESTGVNYMYNGNYIEGFVIEAANDFKIKIKCGYYNFWKRMRSIKDSVVRAKIKLAEVVSPSNSQIISGKEQEAVKEYLVKIEAIKKMINSLNVPDGVNTSRIFDYLMDKGPEELSEGIINIRKKIL